MNLKELEKRFIDDYDVSVDVKASLKYVRNIKLRKVTLRDNNFSCISIIFQYRGEIYRSYIFHHKQFIGHYFFLVPNFIYRIYFKNRNIINENVLTQEAYKFSSLETLISHFKKQLNVIKRL